MKHPDPPSKPSELIRLALRDLREVEADPRYAVNMADWHNPHAEICHVCFAGAVMAKSLGTPVYEYSSYCDHRFSTQWQRSLDALDSFRLGLCWHGAGYMGLPEPKSVPDRVVPEYAEDPSAFHLAMEALAAEYEAVGA